MDETLEQVRNEHGKKASSWLADKLGVSRRTAQRYLAGTQNPSKRTRQRIPNVERSVRRKVAAGKISRVRSMNVGRVVVINLSAGDEDGTRDIGNVSLPPEIMEEIAALYADGQDQEAEDLLNQAIVNIYANDDPHDRGGLGSVLYIDNYSPGMSYRSASPPPSSTP
ncbi:MULTISPECIES: helix-turn-helix transcriptional regulator [Actinomycetes]|uniref:helix-turn-helix transcriptional regulator n=1 Tax=Actinomycetes TaxID=1760 RepID=UPI0031E8D51A